MGSIGVCQKMKAGGFLRQVTNVDDALLRLARIDASSPLKQILAGLGFAVLALILRVLLNPVFGGITGFAIMLPAILLAALAAGRLGGLVATFSALAGAWELIILAGSSYSAHERLGPVALPATITFLFIGLFCVLVGASLRKTLTRLEASSSALRLSDARVDETEDRLQVISEFAPTMLWMSDPQGRCVHMNADQRRFWGVSDQQTDFGSLDLSRAFHPDDHNGVFKDIQHALTLEAPFEFEARQRRADGVYRIIRSQARPRIGRKGEFLGMIGVNLDVTDARAAEKALRDSETQLQAMVDQASAGIARVDLNGRITMINARFAEILGVTPEAAIGIGTRDVTHPDDIDPTFEALDAIRAGGPGDTLVKRYVHSNGSVVWAMTSVRVLNDENGQAVGFIAVAVDVTAAKAAETALRESETRFRLIADTAPAPIWLTNAHGEVEFANQALAEFYGRPASTLQGQVWEDKIHPDDRAAIIQAQNDARPRRLPYGFEVRFRRQDDEWRWVRVSVKPRFDAANVFRGYVGMGFDVTATREALDALGRQERRQTFLLALTDRLRDLSDPDAIMGAVESALGELLEVDRVGYGEVDLDAGVIDMTRDWTAGVASARGQFSLDDLGASLIDDLASGQTVRVDDVRTDPRTAGSCEVFDDIQTRALIRAPLIRGGRLRAYLYVHSATPRFWTDAEAALLEEVAARTWAEVERARAEAETRESEARFRAIADIAPVLIWVTRQDGTRSFVNQAYSDFYGDRYEDAREADWLASVHADDRERMRLASQAGEASGGPFSLEGRYLRHDGEWRWIKSWSRPRRCGSTVQGYVGVAFDVTDMREAQARIEESETRFRIVADSAPALIWMSDDSAQLNFGNRRYRSFFGVRSSRQLTDSWRALIHPDDEQVFSAAYMRAFAARDVFEAMARVNHPTLGLRWLRTEGVPRFDAEGRFQGYVGASLDITDAKRAEDDLKRINELLEERVSAALDEKAQAEAQLVHAQRMEAVGRLTGGVAHDFNNLLTVVIGALDIILRSEDPAKRRKLGEAALAAARRGESLTHQLLAFSRRQALRPEEIDLNTLIRESAPLLRRAVGEAVEFNLKLKRGAARVRLDPAQFEAALLNLIVNARDALGDVTGGQVREGGQITVQTAARRIAAGEVAELSAGDYVCVTISDNGEGMSPEVIDRVFEPFFTTKGVGKGTGLGLSQVYGFAHQSGGGVQVASTMGQGAAITLFLPRLIAKRTSVPTLAPPQLDVPFAQGRRLLLVEDDAAVAAIAVDLLESFGLEVQRAENGPAALDALRASRFDLMLTDVVMPGGMSGIDLARRSARDWPDMRIALTSGYVGEDVDQLLSDSPWSFLRKPYSAEALRNLVEGRAPQIAE